MGVNAYDYIIVGAGSAGCVIANRLSTNSSNTVCLIEAGPKDLNPFIHMPMGIVMVLRSKKLNWHFWTTPQSHCNNREMYWPRGKTLGGSSSINAMCYVRGNAKDYDDWAKLGNKGWSFQDVLPYFKKLEHDETKNTHDHNEGSISVDNHQYINPLMDAFVTAGNQAGYTTLGNYNESLQEGVGYFAIANKKGQRCSNARGYLHPIKKRQNLTVITKAHVTKILFEGKKAIGISLLKKGKIFNIFAHKEVILTAGAIGSPHLLLLSGVGPRAEIAKFDIPLIHDLPGVGENLQDHLDIHITCLDKTHTSLSFRPSALWRLLKASVYYLFKRKGELTSNYTQATGFAKSEPELEAPDLQWHFGASMYTNTARNLMPVFKYYGYVLMTCFLHPQSRGSIRLRSNNPLDKPLIDPNYLKHESDLDKMLSGFKKARRILAQEAFKPYFLKEYEPGNHIQTDEEIRNYIRQHAQTIYHPVGTCKMGTDSMAVVNPENLKVYGLENLRVIDASVMPTLPSGNTNAPTTMIAEKGADMIIASLNGLPLPKGTI